MAVRLEVSDDQLLYRISAGGNALGSDTFDRSSPELLSLIREMLRFALKQPQSIPSFFNLYRSALNVMPSFFAVAVLL